MQFCFLKTELKKKRQKQDSFVKLDYCTLAICHLQFSVFLKIIDQQILAKFVIKR
jgi:hypothetical protein